MAAGAFQAEEMSAQAAMTDEPTCGNQRRSACYVKARRVRTIRVKATRVSPVTIPLNMNTSP